MVFCVDMDVLDFSEEQDVSYCFYCDGFVLCNVGMMYVCGYDGYIVIGFGLVYIFKQFEFGLYGVIKLIFQFVEEGMCGVWVMVDVGVVDDVDYFIVVYIGIGVFVGIVVCGSDNFMVIIKFDVYFIGIVVYVGVKLEDGYNVLLAAV